MELDGWLTLAEAAKRIGLAASTLQRQAVKGQLRAEKRAKTWFTRVEWLAEYQEQHQGRVGRPRKQVEPEG